MIRHMFGLVVKEVEIFRTIIQNISIYVVNSFRRNNISTNKFTDHKMGLQSISHFSTPSRGFYKSISVLIKHLSSIPTRVFFTLSSHFKALLNGKLYPYETFTVTNFRTKSCFSFLDRKSFERISTSWTNIFFKTSLISTYPARTLFSLESHSFSRGYFMLFTKKMARMIVSNFFTYFLRSSCSLARNGVTFHRTMSCWFYAISRKSYPTIITDVCTHKFIIPDNVMFCQ